mmetsp:Transcript_9758/g.18605  ORF Transcript_9758/g.18605 Transcript_9758/m.18605 type:complete len:289 (+) Transcript_9758:51-917(+)|eukprot:CAMPEP_0175141052 /NCGR_PEP_ID=MMETSP0087-20121206/11866_1 /TAXON_ID=136419 /ORGANISM="Unknown Unknown, Strain D1" /LENGTH=288 /DNA_ID=CAMNT_0016424375 /DNA_START=49 /DNA_END=915 /DNA_ORIENTATION=-
MDDGSGAEVKEDVELRVLIENNQVGPIIGKTGANVRRIREDCNVFLSILKAESQNVIERVMVLKGSTNALIRSVRILAELMIEADAKVKKCVADLVEGTASIRLLAHRNQVGAVIGKAGALIKETIAETSCRVHVSQEPLPGSTEKTITLTGNPQAIYNACSRVMFQLKQYKKGVGKVIPYVPGPALESTQSFEFESDPMMQTSYDIDPAQLSQQKIAIPTVCAGAVIGKGGSKIRELRTKSGANISIAEKESSIAGERVVTLTGIPQNIRAAIGLISNLVENFQPQQ